ncbi:MAG: undecaprenyl/decaprenyl-phosphate alpha-N-acetylglucosaminyl 1-phosphate transferase [Chloroflexi bacterium]|nr:undecaprenyl/decaprenyl-phosphate alpha-N-acetylglucosaminyl 1-phosphate transferase [Chloroflexota bacterium]
MTTYLLIFATALTLAIGITPVARRLAVHTGIVDRPSGRKLHQHTTPLLGGAAIYLAAVIALALVGDRFYVPQVVGIFLGATFVSFLGIWDDRWHVSPPLKLGGQVLAAALLVATGVQVEFLPHPVLNVALTLLWVIGITNALNLLDNMDGLSGGVAAIASAFFLVMAAYNGQFLVASLAAALLGACLGFLYYNFNPARIFMGDTGSLFLGFALAAVGIKLRFPANEAVVTWMVPVIVLGLPVFDTCLVVVSRLRRGLNPLTTPGKDHLSHRLTHLGLSQREAVMALYLVCGALGMVALLVMQASRTEASAVGAALAGVGAIALWQLEFVRPPPPRG